MFIRRAATMAAVALTAVSASAAGESGSWELSKMEALDPAQWTAAGVEGDVSFRAARGGRTAVLSVPAWWGESFRPPEATVVVLHVRYKDTAGEPVVALSHAGVAPYWGLTELHRFGGLADGRWKTAEVPVSWDLICRKADGANTEIAFRSPTDLPIARIDVRPAGADAAERYFRETRKWIARVQADKRRAADAGPPLPRRAVDSPRREAGVAKAPLVVYPCDWMTPLWAKSPLPVERIGKPIRIRMARNECETAAFGVYANPDGAGGEAGLVNVRIRDFMSLKNDRGEELKCRLELRAAEYSAVQATVDYSRTSDSGKYRLYPQRLWPAYPVDIPAGRSHPFFVTVGSLGQASKPGRYTGEISITADLNPPLPQGATDTNPSLPRGAIADGPRRGSEVSARLPIEVEVLPVTLLTVTECGLSHSTCTSGLPTMQEVKTLVEHNHNGVDIWFGGTQPGLAVRDGKLELDWTYMDDWMVRAKKAGLNHVVWFFGGDPAGFPDTLNLERDLYRCRGKTGAERDTLRREFIRRTNAAPEKVLPELRPLYVDFIRQLAAHAKEKGWPKLILQPFDEPGKYAGTHRFENRFEKVIGAGPWIEGHFRDGCELIRQGCPEATTALEAHVVKPCLVFLKDVDIFCTNRAFTVADLPATLEAAGVTLWQYANCDDQAPAHRSRFSYGFFFASFNSRGSLVWAYNAWRRFDTSGPGNWGYGWHSPFGTIITPSMIGMREGLDDRRWVETFRRRQPPAEAGGSAKADVLAEVLKQARAARAETPYTSYNEAARPEKMDLWRDRIIDAMTKKPEQP